MAAAASSSSPVAALGADGECTLLGGPFAICVQIGLAAAAIATLVVKRHTERPRRPWLVWFFDASKQAFAGFLQHCVNLVFGVAFAASGAASECAWYLTNFVISVMCGVLLLNLAMAGYNRCVDRFGLHLLRSGEYGKPPSWRPWLMQMLVWGFLASAEKAVTAVVVILPLHSRLDAVAQLIEAPVYHYPKVELLLVMVFAPVILNALFFWAIDSLIMRRTAGRMSGAEADDARQPLLEEGAVKRTAGKAAAGSD